MLLKHQLRQPSSIRQTVWYTHKCELGLECRMHTSWTPLLRCTRAQVLTSIQPPCTPAPCFEMLLPLQVIVAPRSNNLMAS